MWGSVGNMPSPLRAQVKFGALLKMGFGVTEPAGSFVPNVKAAYLPVYTPLNAAAASRLRKACSKGGGASEWIYDSRRCGFGSAHTPRGLHRLLWAGSSLPKGRSRIA